MFRCLHPKRIQLQPGDVRGWQLAEARSKATHDHFFACVNETWKNLPDDLQTDFPSAEHLRKWALIKAGFCTQTRVACRTVEEALKLAATARQLDKYALVEVSGTKKRPGRIVTIWTADSQRKDEMGRKVFQEAKDRALHVLSDLIGTDVTTLRKETSNAQA